MHLSLVGDTKSATDSESLLLEELELVAEQRVDDMDHPQTAVRLVGVLTLAAVNVDGELQA